MKFGGTSVADAEAFARVAAIIETRSERQPFVVVSAMSGVTDALVMCVEATREHKGEHAADFAPRAEEIRARHLDQHLARHRTVADELLPVAAREEFEATLGTTRARITHLLTTLLATPASMRDSLHDTIVSHGELLSSRLLALVLASRNLPARFVDARRCVITDDRHTRARPLMRETVEATNREAAALILAGVVPVLGGFIGSSTDGATTTLGRNGSDYSAALVGAALRARLIEIWTDTPGILTADPRLVPAARRAPRLTYGEATELARAGAKVLYPKTIAPLVEHSIPLHVRNSRDPQTHGTSVAADTAEPGAKSIALRRGVTIINVAFALDAADDHVNDLFDHTLARHGETIDLCLSTHASATFVVSDEPTADKLAAELAPHNTIHVERRRALITIIGERMNPTAHEQARVLDALDDMSIDMHVASTASRSFVVEDEHAIEAIKRLHRALFENE